MAGIILTRLVDQHYEALVSEWGAGIDPLNAIAIARKRALKEIAAGMASNPTDQELDVWCWLEERPLGFKFEFQKPFNRYICDFFCRKAKLIIEIDGAFHRASYDAVRDQRMWNKGFQTLRFTNDEVITDFDGLKATVSAALAYRKSLPAAA